MAENTETKQNKELEQEMLEKREIRRRRRKRNQTIAYLCIMLVLALLISGIGVTVWYTGIKGKDFQKANESLISNLDEILGTEETLEKPNPEDMIPELTPEQKLDELINAAIEVMPLEDKVAGLFIVTPESITGVNTAVKAGDGTKEALGNRAVGGLVYDSKNIQSAEQFAEMLSNTALYSRYPVFLAVSEEGGEFGCIAQRGLAEKTESAANLAAAGNAESAYAAAGQMAGYLASYGINLNLAPTADIANVAESIATNYAYGTGAESASALVASMVSGLEENGVSACLKHFPGIGASVTDPDKALVNSSRTAEQFRAEEFVTFKAGIDAGADFVMVSHMTVPAFVSEDAIAMPSSMSEELVSDVLRDELGFEGVIISDPMNVAAITEYYESDEAAVYALRAGCDMILSPDDFEKAYAGVLAAVQEGVISEERINDSLRRIYRIKYADKLVE